VTILLSTFGSLGDVHPYLALALEAKARGHRPIFATSGRYRAKIEAQGLELRAVAPDLPDESDFAPLAKRVMDTRDGSRFLFQELLGPSIARQYHDLLAASEDADFLITHPAALAGPLVARKLGKPWLSSVLAPISLWSRRDPAVPPTHPQLDWLRAFGPLWGAFQVGMGHKVTRSWTQAVEMFQREQGLERAGHPLFEGQFSPHGTLALFSRHFAAPQSDWPHNTLATGFCFYDAQGHTAQEDNGDWRAWMQEGQAPLVWTLGSSAVHDAGDFYVNGARECRQNGRRALLLAGENAAQLGSEAPDNEIKALSYAPYSQVFPLAAAVVHQGGVGTTAQALRAGVPQIIFPFAHDQPDNAGRIARLGVGFEFKAAGGRAISSLFERFDVLSKRAREIGELIREENGPRAACEAIERVAAYKLAP